MSKFVATLAVLGVCNGLRMNNGRLHVNGSLNDSPSTIQTNVRLQIAQQLKAENTNSHVSATVAQKIEHFEQILEVFERDAPESWVEGDLEYDFAQKIRLLAREELDKSSVGLRRTVMVSDNVEAFYPGQTCVPADDRRSWDEHGCNGINGLLLPQESALNRQAAAYGLHPDYNPKSSLSQSKKTFTDIGAVFVKQLRAIIDLEIGSADDTLDREAAQMIITFLLNIRTECAKKENKWQRESSGLSQEIDDIMLNLHVILGHRQ